MNPNYAIDDLKESFESVDFGAASSMSALLEQCKKRIKKLQIALESLEETKPETADYDHDLGQLLEDERSISEQLKECTDGKDKKILLSDLRLIQFKIKAFSVEKTQFEQTSELWLNLKLDIQEALNILQYMQRALERNMALARITQAITGDGDEDTVMADKPDDYYLTPKTILEDLDLSTDEGFVELDRRVTSFYRAHPIETEVSLKLITERLFAIRSKDGRYSYDREVTVIIESDAYSFSSAYRAAKTNAFIAKYLRKALRKLPRFMKKILKKERKARELANLDYGI